VLRVPSFRRRVDVEMGKAQTQIEDKLIPSGPDVVRHLALPSSGHDLQWILSEMDAMDSELGQSPDWRHGRLSGAVYHGGEELQVGYCPHPSSKYSPLLEYTYRK
jgi:sphinganine-1-phosphate aldolase